MGCKTFILLSTVAGRFAKQGSGVSRCWYRGECTKHPQHTAEEWRRDLYGEQNMNALYDQCARGPFEHERALMITDRGGVHRFKKYDVSSERPQAL